MLIFKWVFRIAIIALGMGGIPVRLGAVLPKGVEYFPSTLGSWWVYETVRNDGKERFDMRVTIDPSDQSDVGDGEIPAPGKGVVWVTMTQRDPRGSMRSFMVQQPEGLFNVKTAVKKPWTPWVTARHDPPIPLVVFPLEPGGEFQWKGLLKIGPIKKPIVMRGQVFPEEEIEVPAGRFRCVKIYYYEQRGKETVEEWGWYAAGVGQVKYIGGNYAKRLKSFHIEPK
ncbi:MAG: hypothetical protein HYZ73_05000 [Elusimicrobia bacterium]|nr:hypothetical protein [Elusimicrobiota bacterium]